MGFSSTRDVKLEHMEYHVGAVRRGAPDTHVIGDLPYGTDRDAATALASARRLIAAGADSVKLEGPRYDVIRQLVESGIAVCGHAGLTPQTAASLKQVGREAADADRLVEESRGIEAAGAFMLVLEHIPAALGERVTGAVGIPTIGIGAGPACDGQVLVTNDLLGLGEKWPPFSRQYAYLGKAIAEAARNFVADVEERRFK
jgi:3-methyl-2-oxobutanoate hydroxymethyltransferase